MCDYNQWKKLETYPVEYSADVNRLTSAIPIGTCMTAWLQRTTNLLDCPAGPGANCNNWNMPNDEITDGEFVTICNNAGTLDFAYDLDCDPVYDSMDPSHNAPGLECSVMRSIPCCYKTCIP